MKTFELLSALKKIRKPFFSLSDLETITKQKRNSLKVAIFRLCKKEIILRLSKGIFVLPENIDKIPEIANQIYSPSYFSFESALSRYGIISQIPYTITFATKKRTKKIALGKKEIEYRQLKPSLFFGFKKENNLFIALPEKALLDELYFVSRGKAVLSFDELDSKPINKKIFFKFSKSFPLQTQKIAKNLLKF